MSATEYADSGQTTIEQEAAGLAELSASAWVRATLERNNDGEFRATRIELTIGAEPRGFDWLDWDYGSCALVSCPTSPSEIAAWLRDGHGAVKPQVRNIEFAMPSVSPMGTWENLPSRSSRDRPALEWPYRRAVFHEIEPRTQLVPAAVLVSPDAPSFPTFDLASEVFVRGDERSFTPMTSYDALIIGEQTSDVVLHREWCRELGRVAWYRMGVDGTRRHERRANNLVSARNPKVGGQLLRPPLSKLQVRAGAPAPALSSVARMVPKMAPLSRIRVVRARRLSTQVTWIGIEPRRSRRSTTTPTQTIAGTSASAGSSHAAAVTRELEPLRLPHKSAWPSS